MSAMSPLRSSIWPSLLLALIFIATLQSSFGCPTGCKCTKRRGRRTYSALCFRPWTSSSPANFREPIESLTFKGLSYRDIKPYTLAAAKPNQARNVRFISVMPPRNKMNKDNPIPRTLFQGLTYVAQFTITNSPDRNVPEGLVNALPFFKRLQRLLLSSMQLPCNCMLPQELADRNVVLLSQSRMPSVQNCPSNMGYTSRSYRVEAFLKECEKRKRFLPNAKMRWMDPSVGVNMAYNMRRTHLWGRRSRRSADGDDDDDVFSSSSVLDVEEGGEIPVDDGIVSPDVLARTDRDNNVTELSLVAEAMSDENPPSGAGGVAQPAAVAINQPVETPGNPPVPRSAGMTRVPPMQHGPGTGNPGLDRQRPDPRHEDAIRHRHQLASQGMEGASLRHPSGNHNHALTGKEMQLAMYQLPTNDLTVRLNPYDPFEVDLFFQYVLHEENLPGYH